MDESGRIGLRRCVRSRTEEAFESFTSMGGVSGESSENEEEKDDAISSQGRWLDSFSSSLENSFPIKRGLSSHYIGKSKSFGNLMKAKDLEKVESPLNKRRRLLVANKLRSRSSLSSFKIISPNSMHLLALQESDEEEEYHKYNDDDDQTDRLQEKRMKMKNNNRDFMIQTRSCLCLSSFQDDHQ